MIYDQLCVDYKVNWDYYTKKNVGYSNLKWVHGGLHDKCEALSSKSNYSIGLNSCESCDFADW